MKNAPMPAELQPLEGSAELRAVTGIGLFALGTPNLDEVVEEARRTVRETLRVDDVSLLRGGETPPEGATVVAVHARDHDDRPYGLLTVRAPAPLHANDITFLEGVANVVASAVARKRMEDQLRVAE